MFYNLTYIIFAGKMKRFITAVLFLILCLLYNTSSFAQDGTIKGKIMDKGTGEPIPFANIIAERGGKQMGGGTTDFDGYYTIKPLQPGKYNVKVTYIGYKSIMMTDLIVNPDKITFQDLKMESTVEELDVVEIIDYKVQLISKDNTSSGESVTRDDIATMPTRSATGIAATVGGVFQKTEGGGLNIRGSRDGANDVYIDGVKVRGSSSIPQSAIEQVSVVTGGLPAKYGDATGGIISITTRGPSATYYGGVEVLSSGFYVKDKNIGIDPYAYNLVGLNFSGPLLKIWDKVDSTRKPLLGFFLAAELTSIKNGSPSAIGMWKVKDEVMDDLKKYPLRASETGSGVAQSAEFVQLTRDDGSKYFVKANGEIVEDPLEKIKIKQNVGSKGITLSGKTDVRTGPNINLTFGGSLDFNKYRNYGYSDALFNYENNEQVINNTWRIYGRFSQKFSSGEDTDEESTSIIKNAYYTLHIDYTKFKQRIRDPIHKDKIGRAHV